MRLGFLLALISSATTAAPSFPVSRREQSLGTALVLAFDHDGDGVIKLAEAAWGIRSMAEGAPPDPAVPREVVEKRSMRECGRAVYFTDEVSYVLDCVAEFAREELRENGLGYVGSVDLGSAMLHLHRLAGSPENRHPPGQRHCDDLVDEGASPLEACAGLELEDYCKVTCHQYQRPDDVAGKASQGGSGASIAGGKAGAGAGAATIPVLLTSDWHVEPWFDTSNNRGLNAGGDKRVSRFDNSTAANQWTCKSSHDADDESACTVTNSNDPPLNFIDTHLEYFAGTSGSENDLASALFFFIGDTQAHDEVQEYEKMDWIQSIVSSQEVAIASVLARFADPARVFVTAGNNDGPHGTLFVRSFNESTDNALASLAWSEAYINAGIVTNALGRFYNSGSLVNVSATDFFNSTGYYLKQVPMGCDACDPLFVMVLNCMLGEDNVAQNDAMASDLGWVKSQSGSVLVFGHYPSQMSQGTAMRRLQGYEDIVIGTFAGHTHVAGDTTSERFTQVPAVSQGGTKDNGFFTFLLDPSSPSVLLTVAESMVYWAGEPGKLPSAQGWQCCGCSDVPPDDDYTCAEQKDMGRCGRGFMKGHCCKTCFACRACI